VCLPTGLGKTWIGAIVILNFYLWYPKGKIYFLAPTKPLVAQQLKTLSIFNEMIPESKTALVCGNVTDRDLLYRDCRVFFMTPQTMENDLQKRLI
jgi:ERCC4-related helicase